MSDDALFTDAPAPTDGALFTDEPPPKSLAGFGSNLVDDVKGNVKGLAGLAQGLSEHPIDTIKNIPGGLVNEGKRIGLGELLTGHPMNAVQKFGNAAYDKPLSTLMDVAPAVGAAGKALGIGGAAAEGADAAGAAAKTANVATDAEKAAGVIPIERVIGNTISHDPMAAGIPEESGTITPKIAPPEEPPVTPGAVPKPPPAQVPTAPGLADQAAAKAQEVKNYISHGYEGYAKKPGAISDLADYVQEKSQMMAGQQMGFTPLQNRQLGVTPTAQLEAMRAIGQYGLDSGIVSPAGGLRHMVETNAKLLDQAGKTLGDLRKEADSLRDAKALPIDPVQAIHQQLDSIFARGTRAGEAGAYKAALETVEDHPATFEGMAKAATDLNKAANQANRLNQPHGAFTDVANVISRIENERIRQVLGPQKATAYEQALKEFGINKKIEAALKRKVGGEVKRFGPGSVTSNLTQKALDEVGYRVGARAANKLATTIKGNPSAARTLPSLFKEFANHIDETTGEVSGLYKGGVVPKDVRDYVASRGC